MAGKTPASRFSGLGAKQLNIEFETAKKDRHRVAEEFIALCNARTIKSDNEAYLLIVRESKATLESLNSILNEISSRDSTLVDKRRDESVARTRTAYVDFLANLQPAAIPPKAATRLANPLPSNVTVPTFDGKVENWPGFKNFYDSLVHQADSPDLVKFHCLRSALQGPAAKLIEGITLSAENYQMAYNKVAEQFTNGQRLASYYYTRLRNVQTITKSSPTAFREFINTHNIAMQGLKAQNIPDLADYLGVQLSLPKLSEEVRLGYESSLGQNEFPSTDSLESYLNNRARVLENVANQTSLTLKPQRVCLTSNEDGENETRRSTMRRSPSPPSTSDRQNNTARYVSNRSQSGPDGRITPPPKIRKCMSCDGAHSIHSCPQFKQLEPKERYDRVKELDLCEACLGPHRIRNCRSKTGCRFCGSNGHNTHLHQYWEQVQQNTPTRPDNKRN
jgi:hypothetical protein